ncbi:MAG: ATP-binding protein [Bacteroidota bacterium]
MDKNKLFGILSDWNYWDKPVPEYVPRAEYQSKMNAYLSTGEIIILTGIRRSGKSTLMINHIRHLISAGVNKNEILFVNFEDPRFNSELNSDLLERIFEVYKEFVNHETKPHIFLDEVQNVIQWEKWVLAGYELNRAFFYITGSSSKLLSREFGTALSGRYLGINVFPLSYKEYLLFKKIPAPDKKTMVTQRVLFKKAFNRYIKEGGFPKINYLEDDLQRPEIIMYYETIILKDIVARHNLKNLDNVKKVALYLLSNIGKPINLNKLRTALKLSYDLADKYFEYLKDTFLLFEVNQFDYSLNRQFANRRKVYCIDNGILANTSFRISEDYGRYLENLVYIELRRRGNEVYFHFGKKECDFIIKEGLHITRAIQVSRTLQDEHTKKRELEGLMEALQSYRLKEGVILTEDEEDEIDIEVYKIIVKPVWKWMLENKGKSI